ncbi:DUF262 domain-containing protein [Amycolatopsis taiwanensis]|uniref:DUF262 domain-containing protein n=1 Tax=Amycolatopsis taiwanensis TaxID=342230 RepID=UPI000489FA2A|nr:DUF262 domain-containing protein [Amycolatopsis taiwanensis]
MATPGALRGVAQPRVQTVGELLAELDDGSLRIELDRTGAAEWSEHRKHLLLDSILRGWPIGPLYALVAEDGRRTVVDGGRRLGALREFTANELDVDGRLTPHSDSLSDIDSKTYQELPSGLRSAFDDYPVVVIEFNGMAQEDIRPALFRLNDVDRMSAAQRRVVESGKFGEQIRELTSRAADWGLTTERIGFSNVSLFYEDVLGRVIVAVEQRDLGVAGSDSASLTERLRAGHPTPPDVYAAVSDALKSLITRPELAEPAVRFSKATLASWLLLMVFAQRQFGPDVEHYIGYLMDWLEPQRRRLAVGLDLDSEPPFRGEPMADLPAADLLAVFNDRAAVEAMTSESLCIRDAVLWMFLVAVGGVPTLDRPPVSQLLVLRNQIGNSVDLESVAAAVHVVEWGRWA